MCEEEQELVSQRGSRTQEKPKKMKTPGTAQGENDEMVFVGAHRNVSGSESVATGRKKS